MPSPGAPAPPRLPIEDSYFELLADTLENLDLPARGQFLQRYLRTIAHLNLRESQSVQIWEEMIARRRELADLLGRPVALKTALTDVLSSSGLLRLPILIEYEELKRLELNAVTDPLTGLFGDGEQTRDFTYVENAVLANLLACEAPNVSGKVFNVGVGGRVSLNEVLRELAKITGRSLEAKYEPPRDGDIRDSQADISQARELLGYEPQVTFE